MLLRRLLLLLLPRQDISSLLYLLLQISGFLFGLGLLFPLLGINLRPILLSIQIIHLIVVLGSGIFEALQVLVELLQVFVGHKELTQISYDLVLRYLLILASFYAEPAKTLVAVVASALVVVIPYHTTLLQLVITHPLNLKDLPLQIIWHP